MKKIVGQTGQCSVQCCLNTVPYCVARYCTLQRCIFMRRMVYNSSLSSAGYTSRMLRDFTILSSMMSSDRKNCFDATLLPWKSSPCNATLFWLKNKVYPFILSLTNSSRTLLLSSVGRFVYSPYTAEEGALRFLRLLIFGVTFRERKSHTPGGIISFKQAVCVPFVRMLSSWTVCSWD